MSYILVMKEGGFLKFFLCLHPLKSLTWNVLICIGPMCFHTPRLTGAMSVEVLKSEMWNVTNMSDIMGCLPTTAEVVASVDR